MERFILTLESLRSFFRNKPELGALCFLLFFLPVSFSPLGGVYFEAVKYSVLFIGIGSLLYSYKNRETWIIPKSKILLTLLVLLFFSSLLALDPLRSFLGYYPRYNNFFFLYIFCFIIFLSVQRLGAEEKKLLVKVALSGAVLVAVFGILQSKGVAYYGGISSFFKMTASRVPSLLGNPNFSSMYVAMFFPVTLELARQARKKSSALFYLVSNLLLIWGVAIFSSRGAILAGVLGLSIYGLWCLKNRDYKVFFAALASLVIFFNLSATNIQVFRGNNNFVYTGQDSSATDRYLAWSAAGKALEENPVFGVGAGSFQTFFWQNWSEWIGDGMLFFDDPHNFLLYIPATVGLPFALLFFAGLVFALCLSVVRAWREKDGYSIAIISAVVSAAFSSLFNPFMMSMWVTVAAFLGVVIVDKIWREQRVITPTRLLRGCLVAASLVLVVWGVGSLLSEHLLVLAEKKLLKNDLEKAQVYGAAALTFNPVSTQAANMIALTYFRTDGENKLTESMLNYATFLEPYSPFNLITCGNIYSEIYFVSVKKETYLHKANDCYKAGLGISPGHLELELQYGEFLLRSGKTQEAEVYIKRGVVGNQNNPKGWLLLAKFYLQNGDIGKLIYSLSMVRSILPEDRVINDIVEELVRTGTAVNISLEVVPSYTLRFNR